MKYNNELLNKISELSIEATDKKINLDNFRLIEFNKKGGIHIKESQKGSFTKYCNGKVTNECIARGKRSPDPKIRRKAVFADNSRK